MDDNARAARIAELRAIIKTPIGQQGKPAGIGRLDNPPSLARAYEIRQAKIRRARAKRELARLTRNR